MFPLSSVLPAFALFLAASAAGPIGRRAISTSYFQTFQLYEQYAAAAYCPGNNNSPNTKLICPSGNCPLVQSSNTSTVTEFQNTLETDATGFVATDNTNKVIVISFRGSVSLRNFITDFNFPLMRTSLCPNCQGSTGFWTSWVEARPQVLDAVKKGVASNPGYKIVATGHSLGGAMATFAAAELRNLGYNVDLCTFGSPRVGDDATATFITNQAPAKGANWRMTHWNDPVPRLPPRAFDYAHVSPEYYISVGNGAQVTSNDFITYQGITNSQGNAKWILTDILAHGWYFNQISACNPGIIEI
ncbi:alpha/beta-hydrolase [Trichodelitschia bisporula]|uniref:Alpha/beta-hydrolase n=1 Tax=Trichodelitschia bisporula TaxID=703511 RepID=A0A6G1I6F1_9PEZI|nr:alpha/beta-hydrolase [Trichodelitschia bisporula]